MAENYCNNPNLTSHTNNWLVSAGTLDSTPDGGRLRNTQGYRASMYYRIGSANGPTAPNGPKYALSGVKVRRNTEASGGLWYFDIGVYGKISATESTMHHEHINLRYAIFPVGEWVELPNIVNEVDATDYFGDGAFIQIRLVTNEAGDAADFTVKGFGVYKKPERPADAVLEPDDAVFVATVTDDSLYTEFRHQSFDDMVTAITWDFGDPPGTQARYGFGDGGAARGYFWTYATAGTYDVTCRAYNNETDDSTSTTQRIQVPSGAFTASWVFQESYLDLETDGSSSVTATGTETYSWNFGDGTPPVAGVYASHTFSQAGTYDVSLTISNTLGQTNTATKSVRVEDPPNPANYFTTVKRLLAVEFFPSITDGTAYAWAFGDGTTSNTQAPTHTYATAGTYTVTLSVTTPTGVLATVQDVTVTADYTPLRRLVDVLRLEVAVPPAVGAIYNRVPNPSGEQGGYGWVTPTAGATMRGSNTTDRGVDGWKLIYTSAGLAGEQFDSEPYRVTPGEYVAAAWAAPFVEGTYRQQIEFLDAAYGYLSASPLTGYLGTASSQKRSTPALVPAGAAYVRLRFRRYASTTGGTPPVGALMLFRRVMLATGPTSAALADLSYTESQTWLNIIGPTHELKVTRNDLDVGTLSATVLDAMLDPARADLIRPGQRVRLRVAVEDDSGGTGYESLFTGTLGAASVSYQRQEQRVIPGDPPTYESRADPKKTRIGLFASDNISPLAAASEARGVPTVDELRWLLEGKAVPFRVNGSSDQLASAAVVALNENASMLDQIAVTRDSMSGYAWVDRNNVLVAHNATTMPTVVAGVFDEAVYSAVDVSFNTETCINEVRIKWLRFDVVSGETTEIVYGPYTDAVSVEEWGRHSATFTMHGIVENPAAIEQAAARILVANAVPRVRINEVTVPIRNSEDLTGAKALTDLYDLVALSYADTGTREESRVTGIVHTITPTKWLLGLSFSVDGAVASPRGVAPPPAYVPPLVPAVAGRAKMSTATDQSIPHGAFTAIDFTATEYDTGSMVDLVANTITVAEDGLYVVNGSASLKPANSGRAMFQIETTAGVALVRDERGMQSGVYSRASFSAEVKLTAGAAVRLMAYQSSGGAQDTSSAFFPSTLSVRRIP